MGLPSFETTYRRPLNALLTCRQVFPTVPPCPASLLTPRRRIVFHRSIPRHPTAPRTLPPRHRSSRLSDNVSPSAKRPLNVLASFSNRSAMSCIPPGPKTTYRLPQNACTPPCSFQNTSTLPLVPPGSKTTYRRPLNALSSRGSHTDLGWLGHS